MPSRLIAVLLLATLLAGCPLKDLEDPYPPNLIAVTDTYGDTVRWGDLNKLYAFAAPDAHWKLKHLNNITVTGYDASAPQQVKPWLWRVTAVIDYVQNDRQVVKRLVDQQLWVSDDQGKTWYRQNPPPQF